jgi:cytoskeletal protein CcmA (bactofilin family)
LNGTVKGNIDAGDRVELGSKARVLGNVHYAVIETAVGAQINGKLIHRAPAAGAAAAAGTGEGESESQV